MGVVTHGSLDEGPIILALPQSYIYAFPETDPIFNAWDKSTGIAISTSQINDFDSAISTNATVLSNSTKNEYPIADANKLAGIAAGATNVNASLLVPYSGATENVNLGTHDILARKITISDTPINPNDGATKAYVDSVATTGINWQIAVKDTVTNAAALPSNPALYDRYITIDNDHIRQWNGSVWTDITPLNGDTLHIAENVLNPTNTVGMHTYNGIDWVYIGSSMNHNDTLNKQGGSGTDFYHLTSHQSSVIPQITTIAACDVPTGLYVYYKGLVIGEDGTQSAYVVLSWDSMTANNFDHYNIQYKKDSFTYWTTLPAYNTEITIDGLLGGVVYNFRIASVNKYGTVSNYSNPSVDEAMAADTGPPAKVQGLIAHGAVKAVLLTWNGNVDYDLNGYNIYRNTIDDSSTAILVANYFGTKYMDNGLDKDVTYYYWLKAIDTSGNVSDEYSTVASATTRNIIAGDIENIAADQVIIQGNTTFASWITPGTTTIDGSNITTDTITLNKLDFVPLNSNGDTNDIIGTINATAEALKITGTHIEINGSTRFMPLGGNGKVYIFPDANTGIKVVDNDANTVFETIIGGDNVGDVLIGDYVHGQGIWYDKSTGITEFKGRITASSGSISGVLDFGTLPISDGTRTQSLSIKGGNIYEGSRNDNNGILFINHISYNGGFSYFRRTIIGDGKQNTILDINGNTDKILAYKGIWMYGQDNGGFKLPSLNSDQRRALPKAHGLMVYDNVLNQVCVYVNSAWRNILFSAPIS